MSWANRIEKITRHLHTQPRSKPDNPSLSGVLCRSFTAHSGLPSLPCSIDEVTSPAFLIDLDKFKKNTTNMQRRAKKYGVTLRPHTKTHRTLEGAKLQFSETENPKIVVSSLSDAEFYVDSGFNNILFAIPIDLHKLRRIPALIGKCENFYILLDNRTSFEMVEKFGKEHNLVFDTFLKVDTGYHRAGVDPDDEINVKLAIDIANSPNIHLEGVYSHAGHTYDVQERDVDAVKRIVEVERSEIVSFAEKLRSLGLCINTVSIGSTPCAAIATNFEGVNEIHPGNYTLFDRQQTRIGSCSLDDIACCVLTRVISHYPKRNEILIDMGSSAMSKDTCPEWGEYGEIVGFPELEVAKISQDEGVVCCRNKSAAMPFDRLPIGKPLRILPNHCCLTALCHQIFYITEGDQVVDTWIPNKGW